MTTCKAELTVGSDALNRVASAISACLDWTIFPIASAAGSEIGVSFERLQELTRTVVEPSAAKKALRLSMKALLELALVIYVLFRFDDEIFGICL
jgi:hypothetical protein